jgi:hypothetical protein
MTAYFRTFTVHKIETWIFGSFLGFKNKLLVVYPTRQTSTSRTNKKCLSVLIQQVVVILISIQINISKRCLFDIFLMSIFI